MRQPLVLSLILLVAFGLRVYNLDIVPNGLFTDEAARGYDAYSIALTGADMFGVRWPLFPRSLNDYTPALYTYLTVPFVFLLDLSHFSTRIASAWVGVFTVAVAYQAIRRPFGAVAGTAGAALVAISPWYVLLNRIGTEWGLLGLGPMLTIVLAYRGLRRPNWLVGAGVAAGISLYGYAPVKAFLPLLIAAFIAFYWRELTRQRWAGLAALVIFLLMVYPVYSFSLTPEGLIRLNEVSYFQQLPWSERFFPFVKGYLAYLDPGFLFITRPEQSTLFTQRLQYVGLLYWFELPLILIGLWQSLTSRQKDQYFWLVWLLLAPLGINLHIHTKPALWLTATPLLHGLAGTGFAWLWQARLRGFVSSRWITLRLQRSLVSLSLIGIGVLAVVNVRTMVVDLFSKFPRYAPYTVDWGYQMEQGIQDLVELSPAFDSANLDTFEIVSGLYYAYYTRFPPRARHAEVAQYGEAAWRRVGSILVGPLDSFVLEPGCHLTLSRVEQLVGSPRPWLPLRSYPFPDGRPGQIGISAVALPRSESRPVQAIFGEQVMLHSYTVASDQAENTPLEMKPGQAVCLVLNWQSAGDLTTNYTTFVHLVGAPNPTTNSPLWAQHDGVPAAGRRPTTSWQPGELINDMHVFIIPPDIEPGSYRVDVGLYDSLNGDNLKVNQQTRLALFEILIP